MHRHPGICFSRRNYLVDSIPTDYWDQLIPGEDWTIQMEVAHIVQAMMLIPDGVERVRKGKHGLSLLFLVPLPLRNWVNGHIVVPKIAHKFTPVLAVRQYDQAHHAVLACLEIISDEDFQRSATFGSGLHRTIEDIFHRPEQHFAEHYAAIQQKLQKLSSTTSVRS